MLFTSCYQFFQGKIDMYPSGNNSSLSEIFEEKSVITQLSPPEQIFISSGRDAYTDKIIISWSTVKHATSYRLERAVAMPKTDGSYTTPEESDYSIIKSSGTNPQSSDYISSTSYTDIILRDPVYTASEYSYRYYYRISAENQHMYDASAFATTTSYGTLLAPPKNPHASLGESTEDIIIEWAKQSEVSYYKIYRSENENNSNSMFIAKVTSDRNSYRDKITKPQQGIEFYYTVLSQNATGNESVASAPALGYALKEGAPPKVTDVKVTEGRGTTTDKIAITWNATPNATKYAVYRTSSVDSAYYLCSNSVTGTTYEDRDSLKPNVYYYYQVQAIKEPAPGLNEPILKGPFSDSSIKSKAPAEGFILSAPGEITVTKSNSNNSECIITFASPIGTQAYLADSKKYADYHTYTFEIFGGDTQEETFAHASANTTLTASPAGPFSGYYTATVEAKRFYVLRTVYGGIKSETSVIAAPAPSAANNVIATRHAFISGITDNEANANVSGVYPVRITWTAPEGGADGYHVYRSTSNNSGFRKITEEPITAMSYIDKNTSAKAGVYYYYKVLSINSLGQGTNYSNNEAQGYGALTYKQYFLEYDKTRQRSHAKLTLMHEPNDLNKLGKETINGDISGSLSYDGGTTVTMLYTDYADFYINGTTERYFVYNGNTNTYITGNLLAKNGHMGGTVTATGMYPGTVKYDDIQIKGGAAGDGYYTVTPEGFAPSPAGLISWTMAK
ncbi:MAG: hypothetical protein J6I73_05120 [Treponema sp.]|nr:hypothetical protein [Treponema sp.]